MTNEEIIAQAKRLEMDGDLNGAKELLKTLGKRKPGKKVKQRVKAMTRTRGLVDGSSPSPTGSKQSRQDESTPATETSDGDLSD